MPILQAEPSVYPAQLLEPPFPRRVGRWWVIHTKPRQEKALARQLHELEICHYLPLYKKRTRIRGRIVPAYLPLFSGYLFLLGGQDHLYRALATRRTARHLEVVDQQRLWVDLQQIYRLVETGLPLTPETAFAPGSKVEIRSGPLAGLRGVLLRSVSSSRFVVQVDFIQRGASVMLDDYMLECVRD